MYYYQTLTLLVVFAASAHSANILVFMPLSTRSETVLFYPISKELVKRGHDVTIISPYPKRGNMTGITLIQTEGVSDDTGNDLLAVRLSGESKGAEWDMMTMMTEATVDLAKLVAADENVRQFFHSNKKIDLIIVDGTYNDAVFTFVHRFKALLMYVDTAGLHPWNLHSTGNLYAPSTTPSVIGGEFTDRMTLLQRAENVVRVYLWHWFRNNRILPNIRQVMRENGLLLNDTPSFLDIEKQTQLILVHRNRETEFPTPTLSNVVKIGCVHCRDPQPLPKDLQEFADGSGDEGFIFFSFGSVAKLHSNRELVQTLLFSAFAKIPQKILVKWDHDVTNEEVGAPSNVKLVSWAPQQDILGHPKCKVFISHCGLFGTQEAMYHAVPIIGFPLFWDQHYDAALLERQGMAITLELSEVTPESMLEALREITTNPSYRAAAKRMSRFIRDQPMAAMDVAIYWIEYLLRHGGTSLLPSVSQDMHMFQVWMLDVWLLFLGIASLGAFLLYKIIKSVFTVLFTGHENSAKKHKQM